MLPDWAMKDKAGKNMCRCLCGPKCQLIWVDRRSMVAGLHGKTMFSFVRSCQIACQNGVNFAFLPTASESSCCSTSSPAFGGVRILDVCHSNRFIGQRDLGSDPVRMCRPREPVCIRSGMGGCEQRSDMLCLLPEMGASSCCDRNRAQGSKRSQLRGAHCK